MGKKGFTLIEILGVIVLLGVIALIAVPIVNIVIKNTKQSALEQTIATLEGAAYRYSNRNDLGYSSKTQILEIQKLKETGYIKNEELINPVTDTVLEGCIFYRWDENYKQYQFNYTEECVLKDLEVSITNVDGVFNSLGWAKEPFYVKIDSNGTSYSYCVSNKKCSPSALVEKASGAAYITTESDSIYVCAYAQDGAITSDIVCSEMYKLDMTKPTAGTVEIVGTQGANGWYTSDVKIKVIDGVDTLSGHSSTVVNKDILTDNTIGEKIIVTTTDNADNVETREYTVKIDQADPSVNITKTVENNKNVFTVNTNTITSGVSYVWYKDGNVISGETSKTLITDTAGTYKVVITTGSGKTVESNSITIKKFTITYDLNGGTGNIPSQTKIEDLSITLSNTEPKRTGYSFMGWGLTSSSNEAKYISGSTYNTNADLKLYAVWKKTYVVNFVANGASISSTSESCVIFNGEENCNIKTPTITREDWDIIGFSTDKNSINKEVSHNTTISVSSNVTYYAITSKDLTVYFDKNTTSSITATSKKCTIYNTGTSCSITTPTITAQANFTEQGFGTSGSTTTTAISDNTSLTLNSSNTGNTYYALNSRNLIWYFDQNGTASIGATSAGCTIWSTSDTCSITTPSITATSGYTKIGWGTSATSTSSTISENASKTLNNSTTGGKYYALQSKTINITYSGNGADSGSVSSQSCTMYNTDTTCSITLRANGYSKTNYNFQGWSTGTENPDYDASTSYDFSNSLTLNAIWYPNYICSTGTLSYDSSLGYICTSSNAVKRYTENIYTRSSYYTDWECSTDSSASSCSASTGTYEKTTCSTNAITYTDWSCSMTNSSASSCTTTTNATSKTECITNPITYTQTVSTRTHSTQGGAWCQYYSYTAISEAEYSTEDLAEAACRGNSQCEYTECEAVSVYSYNYYDNWEACDETCGGSCVYEYYHDDYANIKGGGSVYAIAGTGEYLCDAELPSVHTYYRCTLMKASGCAEFRTNCVSLDSFNSSHALGIDYTSCTGDFYGDWTVSSTSTVESCTASEGTTSKTECSTNATTYTVNSCTRSINPITYTKEYCTRDIEYTDWEYSYNSGLTSCSSSQGTYKEVYCSEYYICPSGWTEYSGSGSTMKCYKSATLAS